MLAFYSLLLMTCRFCTVIFLLFNSSACLIRLLQSPEIAKNVVRPLRGHQRALGFDARSVGRTYGQMATGCIPGWVTVVGE